MILSKYTQRPLLLRKGNAVNLFRGNPRNPQEIKSMKKEKRTKSIKVWLTPEEHEKLNDLKTGSQLATWMRETCLGKKTKRNTKPPTVDPVLLRHIAAIGNNVNQIAKQCNKNLSPANALDVQMQLLAVERVLQQLRNDYDSENTQ